MTYLIEYMQEHIWQIRTCVNENQSKSRPLLVIESGIFLCLIISLCLIIMLDNADDPLICYKVSKIFLFWLTCLGKWNKLDNIQKSDIKKLQFLQNSENFQRVLFDAAREGHMKIISEALHRYN